MKLVLSRFREQNMQTIGLLNVVDNSGVSMCELKTLELLWRDNRIGISCIPTGTYEIVKRWSLKYGHHFLIKNVPGRSMVLIHSGNYKSQTRGCILVGVYTTFMDKNEGIDLAQSRNALDILDLLLSQSTTLEINRTWIV